MQEVYYIETKNSIQEKEESCQIFHQIETTDIELPNNPSSEENKIDKDEVLTITVEQSTYPVEIEESPIVNTNPTINPNKNINPSQNIADRTEIKIDNANLTKIVKFSPNATLKDWYPLLAEDVDRLNSKSDREFSSNFVTKDMIIISDLKVICS